MKQQAYIDQGNQYLMKTYNRTPIVLEKGSGVFLYDADGNRYLDFAAGIAVHSLGYGNEDYNNALKQQIDSLLHTSNLYYNGPALEAAEKLGKASGMDQVFFTNSGTEAIEGAIKLARKYYFKKYGKSDSQIIAMDHSFHGRSMGALSVTGTKKYREPFEPLIGGAVFASFNDLESVKKLVSENTCAILLEPIQGEGGIVEGTKEFLQGLRQLCDEHDIVLIFDEIQCGMGRTGTMFAYQGYGVEPDVITTAKALGCGVPVGAFAAKDKVAKAFEVGDHGTTYGGNPLATKAVSAVFDLYEKLQVIDHVKKISPYLWEKLEALKEKHNIITDHRGKGLMQALEFTVPVKDIIESMLAAGVIIISAGTNVIRFVPPLIIKEDHVDEMVEKLDQVLSQLSI